MPSLLRRFQAVAAGLLTLAALGLHYLAAAGAGGLWRDEANTVGLATLPTIGDVWTNLQYDSFPIVWIAVVRCFSAVFGPMNDHAFRALGMLVGISLIIALWYQARVFGHRFPLVALALVALSPTVIRWGDSMRGYGLGMTLIVLTNALVWRFLDKPSPRRLIAAAISSVLAVQTLYYNAVLLMAICVAAVVVCTLRQDLRNAIFVIGMGAVAAISLIPYVRVISRASSWNELVRIPVYTVEWFWLRLFEALTPAGSWLFFAWAYFVALAGLVGAIGLFFPRVLAMTKRDREIAAFGLTLLVIGTVGSFAFLRLLRYYTQPWYYLTLILIAAIAADLLLGLFDDERVKLALGLAAFGVGVVTLWNAPSALLNRMTNADLVASKLEHLARPEDFIVVIPWVEGVSFERYYRGQARWATTPSIPFHRFHRYDLILALQDNDQLSESESVLFQSLQETLAKGNTVYVVGTFPAPPSSPTPETGRVPGAPDRAKQTSTALNLGNVIGTHAIEVITIPVPSKRSANRFESMTITSVRGWH